MALAPRAASAVPNDLESYWVPFTPNRAFKQAPRLVARAKDMHYITTDGRQVLDATAGLWCCNAGHNREPIVAPRLRSLQGQGNRNQARDQLPEISLHVEPQRSAQG